LVDAAWKNAFHDRKVALFSKLSTEEGSVERRFGISTEVLRLAKEKDALLLLAKQAHRTENAA